MGKSKGSPPTESLVYRSWLANGVVLDEPAFHRKNPLLKKSDVKFTFFPADQYGPLDTILGADSILKMRIKIPYCKNGSNDKHYFDHWEWIPIQIKGGKNCAFAILPFPDPLPQSIRDRLCIRSRRKAFVHHEKHPTVSCVLYVPRTDKLDEASIKQILDDIWRQTLNLIRARFKIMGWELGLKQC